MRIAQGLQGAQSVMMSTSIDLGAEGQGLRNITSVFQAVGEPILPIGAVRMPLSS